MSIQNGHNQHQEQSTHNRRVFRICALTAGVTLLVVSLGIMGVAAEPVDDDDWNTYESDRYVVNYQDGYHDDAEHIASLAETARDQLQTELPAHVSDKDLDRPVQINLYTHNQWVDEMNNSPYSLYWGTSSGEPVTIHTQTPSDSERDDSWFEHGIAHEIGNQLIWNDIQPDTETDLFSDLPRWAYEGLTEYYVYQTPLVEDRHPHWQVEEYKDDIRSGSLTYDELTEDVYHGGHLLMMYMVDYYGEEATWDVIRYDDPSWQSAVTAELNVTGQQEFERNWYRWAEDEIGGDQSHHISATIDQTMLLEEIETLNQQIDQLKSTTRQQQLLQVGVFTAGTAFGAGVTIFLTRQLRGNRH